MSKLLAAYEADPSERNLARIKAHLVKHPMAACILPPHVTKALG